MKFTQKEILRLLEGLYAISTDVERHTCPLIKRLEALAQEEG